MKKYLDLLHEVYTCGTIKEPARPGLPKTKEIFCRSMAFDLQDDFPLLTTKKMFIKGFTTELCWFLKGLTNIKYLTDRDVHIWDDDAYRFYKYRGGQLKKEEWQDRIDHGLYDSETRMDFGDLGKVYGYQWRAFNGMYDQIEGLIRNIKNNPASRYHLVSAWNPADFMFWQGAAALPACHMLFQCSVRPTSEGNYLDMMMLQRSCDMFLGVPFDIAEYALLCHILALELDLIPGVFTWVGNSCHIYENQMFAVEEQLRRKPLPLCKLRIKTKRHFSDYEPEDFEFIDYKYWPSIKAPLNVGL